MSTGLRNLVLFSLVVTSTATGAAQGRPRARDLGIPLEGSPGPLNAITDVAGSRWE